MIRPLGNGSENRVRKRTCFGFGGTTACLVGRWLYTILIIDVRFMGFGEFWILRGVGSVGLSDNCTHVPCHDPQPRSKRS